MPHIIVILAKGRGDVDNAGAVFGGDIIGSSDVEGLFVGSEEGHELMVFNPLKLPAQDFFHNPEVLTQDCFCQFFGQPVELAFLFCFDICHFRVNSQGDVGRQGPGGGGPDQEVFFRVLALKSHYHSVGFNLLIALSHLVGGQAGAAAGAVGQDFMALIHIALLKELVQQPPY